MGSSSSKLEQYENLPDEQKMKVIEEKGAMVDKVLTENLTNVSEILSQFHKNDTENIVKKIREMPEFKDKIPNNVLERVSVFHKTLLDTIDNSVTDKNKELETDTGIATYIQKYVDKDYENKMQDYINNPFIKNDPIVRDNVVSVANSIKTIRSKYKFFEYKYIQMNMFLMLFIKHVHGLMTKFIDETAAFYEAREQYHLVLIHNVIKTFKDQLGDETKQLSDLDTSHFSNAMKDLTNSLIQSMESQKQLGEKMKQESLNDILKFLMEREHDFASELIQTVDNYKTTHPSKATAASASSASSSSSSPASSSLPVYGPETKPLYIPASSMQGNKPGYVFKMGDKGLGYYVNTGLRGGFIRDNSMIPQDFYKI